MTLAPGVAVGAYEIAGLVGEGGMGQVYRARRAWSGDSRSGDSAGVFVHSGRYAQRVWGSGGQQAVLVNLPVTPGNASAEPATVMIDWLASQNTR